MIEKYKFLDAMTKRLPEIVEHSPLAVVVGDLNVGHRELDIKNWRSNRNQAGFLVKERAYFDKFFGAAGKNVQCVDGKTRRGLGWVDVGRQSAGEVEGPYTWWSARGQAFVNDVGWRLDYHVATAELAATAQHYTVDRAATYEERWSDHAPVVVDYLVN
jgi:exodeoxyribonuclease-3